jgi:GNAT superfamily N-acetyltransferase
MNNKQEIFIKCEPVSKKNMELAIKTQNIIFPAENGVLNFMALFDSDLAEKAYGKNSGRSADYWICKNKSDQVVGITGIYSYIEYPADAWCGWFGILPDYQGLGYGKELFLWTMAEAKKMGFKNFRLYTDLIDNKTAVNLYKKVGMIEEPYIAEDMGEEQIVIFSKSLTPDKSEKFGNKKLFLKKQEEIQKRTALGK